MSDRPACIYDPKVMRQIADFFQGFVDLQKTLEPDITSDDEHPLYLFNAEIVIRHRNGYTIGRIGMDDFPFFEITDETYGEISKEDEIKRAVTEALQTHIRQEDTAAGAEV